MKFQYRVSYLSDGTKVRITPRLFDQLKKWDIEETPIPDEFADILKQQDYDWLCSMQCYYTHNKSLDEVFDYVHQNLHQEYSVEKAILSREFFSVIDTLISKCTIIQRRRFVLHYVFGMTHDQIARMDGVCRGTVQRTLIQAWKTIKNNVFQQTCHAKGLSQRY